MAGLDDLAMHLDAAHPEELPDDLLLQATLAAQGEAGEELRGVGPQNLFEGGNQRAPHRRSREHVGELIPEPEGAEGDREARLVRRLRDEESEERVIFRPVDPDGPEHLDDLLQGQKLQGPDLRRADVQGRSDLVFGPGPGGGDEVPVPSDLLSELPKPSEPLRVAVGVVHDDEAGTKVQEVSMDLRLVVAGKEERAALLDELDQQEGLPGAGLADDEPVT